MIAICYFWIYFFNLLGSSKSTHVTHVPFRQCRLTHALKLALCNRSNVALLCTIRPQNSYLGETLASIRFASRAAKIPITKGIINTDPDPFLQVNLSFGSDVLIELFRRLNSKVKLTPLEENSQFSVFSHLANMQ